MSIPRESLGLTVLHGNLYAIGGDNGTDDEYKSVEAYDPIADVWSNVLPLPSTELASAHIHAGSIHR